MSLTLDTYRLLGRSGLRVSPLALGAATFGTEWGWGAERDDARKLFDRYVERGGNFIDTLRRPGDPNSGGPHRKNLFASVESSLRRLNTDYIDLLYLHVWDYTTPVEEIMRGMDDLIRQGKVLYVAMSNVPAWQISRMQAIADLRGWAPLVALQIGYNLIDRTGERDLIPMARELGLGVVPYSPLAGGVLTGKYSPGDVTAADRAAGDGTRRSVTIAGGSLTERNFAIVDVVREIAKEVGGTPAQVGLAWLLHSPDVTAPVIGARTPAQLEDNVGVLEVELTPDQLARLDEASAFDPGYPHDMLAGAAMREITHGDMKIENRR